MAEKSWGSRRIFGLIVALGAAIVPAASIAQTSPTDRIEAIERQLRSLQSEVQQLKGELGAARQQLRQARSAAQQARQDPLGAPAAGARPAPAPTLPPPAAAAIPVAATPAEPHAVQTAGNRFGIESPDGRNSIYLTGRLHFDVGDYLDYHPQSRAASIQNLNSGVNARRARLGITGKFGGDWAYTLIYDFGGSTDATPGVTGSGIQSAMITYDGFNKGPLPLAFDIGYMNTPFTLQEATSANDLLFVERASIQAVASNIFANNFRSALGVRSNDERYWAGIYLTGPQSGAVHTAGEQYGAFGRATYQLVQEPEYSLHLGSDIGGLLKPPTVGGVQTITLSDRPELRVDPTAILSTGALGTAAHRVTGAAVYGVEGAASYRNFFVQGEYYHVDVDRRGLPPNASHVPYTARSWTRPARPRTYLAPAAAHTTQVPP